ncbi:hypothetical protein EDB83DRAFT_2313118 [Lactarius deliciosus]|nr:hypothetical protein EDB83DRAFT_2313118 [Lactarius deliciosus]
MHKARSPEYDVIDFQKSKCGNLEISALLNPVDEAHVLNAVAEEVEDFDRVLSVNLRGTFLCYKYAGKQMIAQGRGGRIIGRLKYTSMYHSSLSPSSQVQASLSAYSASKFGIRALTQYAEGTISRSGLGTPPGVLEDQLSKTAAVGYLGVPNDIAALVSFIASKESHLLTRISVTPTPRLA